MKTILSLLAGLLLIGTTQTFAQGNFSSNVTTGDWNVAGSWTLISGTDADGVPDADDVVTILDGHAITVGIASSCASLTVGGGTSGILNIGNGAADDLTVSGNIVINAGAIVQAMSTGLLTVGGNITNDGTLDLNNGVNDVNTTFNGTANQTISGTGTTTDFNLISINNLGAVDNNIVEIATTNTVTLLTSGFLSLTAGIFKLSATPTSTQIFPTANYTIPAGAGLWLNASTVVNGKPGTITLGGLLRVSKGSFFVGTAPDQNLEYTGSAAQLILDGGSMSIYGRFCRADANAASTISYTQSASLLTVGYSPAAGSGGSTSTTRALFEIANAGSSFTMSGGTILLLRANVNYAYDYFNEAGTSSVTSSNGLQIGSTNTPAGQNMKIYSTVPVGALFVSNTTNVTTAQLLTALTVNNSLQITPGSTLITNNHNLTVGRAWTNNGTFIAGTGTVTSNGFIARSFTGTTSFYNLVINTTTNTININSAITVTNNLNLIDGIVTIGTGSLTLTDNATVTGASDASFISGPIRKIGNDAFTFPVGKIAGGLYQPITISAPANITDDFTAEYIRSSATALDADVVDPVRNVSGCGYWELTKNSAAAASIDVSLSWNTNSTCGAAPYVTNPETLTVAHYNGAAWDEAGTSGSFTGTSTAGTVTRNAVSVFSPFSLGNTAADQNTLPVKFGTLKAYSKNNGVQLDWDTYTEENVSHYEVQRSVDGNQFSNIGSVTARNLSGRSTYDLFDAAPVAGTNFYRVKSIDKDGKFSYSVIIRIQLGKTGTDITVYPNPVKGTAVSFQSPDIAKGNYTVRLINSVAQQLYSQKINHSGGSLSYTLELPTGIKPGVYYLQVESGEKSFRKKFIVQ